MVNEGQVYQYGYEDGLKGLEASYMLKGTTLYIKIYGSNIWNDYLTCILYAWPRYRPMRKNRFWKVHRKWWKDAEEFSKNIRENTPTPDIMQYRIIGHSAGGAQAYYLSCLLPPRAIHVTSINAPRIGNKGIVESCQIDNMNITMVDTGDIIHHWPFLYRKNPAPRREYASTRPFWKAHNNMPGTWKTFPV